MTDATTTPPPAHHTFLQEAEIFLKRWLPFLIVGAEIGATATGNPELDPIIANAGGAAQAAINAADGAQNGDLASAMKQVAVAVVDAKAAAGITAPAPAQAQPGGS